MIYYVTLNTSTLNEIVLGSNNVTRIAFSTLKNIVLVFIIAILLTIS